jgi:uracil-DNA glycosylase family 4
VSDPRDLLRSYLRQRRELGDAEIVLDRHTPAELRGILSPPRPSLRPPPDAAAAARQPIDRPPADRGSPERAPADRPAADRPSTDRAPGDRPQLDRAAVDRSPAPGDRPMRPVDDEVHVRAGARPPGETPMRPAPDAPARYASAEEIRMLPTLDALREVSLGCPRCALAKTRSRVVFGEGNPTADVLVVGEAPGQDEDRSGRPFVGKAGKLLDLMLMTAGFERDGVFICNVLKCRPPMNRNPMPEEVEACSPYLLRQVELVKPRVILAFGTFAAQTLLGSDISIGKLRGKLHQYHGVPLVPTYHPAAVLRNPGWGRAVWEDLQRARAVLDPPA